ILFVDNKAADQLGRRVDRLLNRLALLGPKGAQHVVGRVLAPRWSTNTDPQPLERAAAQALDDVAQAVVAAVAAAVLEADLAQIEVEIVVDHQQTGRGRSPAFDRLADWGGAVVLAAWRQDETRPPTRPPPPARLRPRE